MQETWVLYGLSLSPELAGHQTQALLCLPQHDIIPLAKLWQLFKGGPKTVPFTHNQLSSPTDKLLLPFFSL